MNLKSKQIRKTHTHEKTRITPTEAAKNRQKRRRRSKRIIKPTIKQKVYRKRPKTGCVGIPDERVPQLWEGTGLRGTEGAEEGSVERGQKMGDDEEPQQKKWVTV